MFRFVSASFLLCFGLCCSAENPQPDVGLASYVGKDLRELDEPATQAFRARLEALTGEPCDTTKRQSFENWWVKPFATADAAWVFLEAYPGYNVPDVSGVRVHVFDQHWNRLYKQTFPTGYRYFLCEVTVDTSNPLAQDLLVARASCSGPFLKIGDESHPAFEQGDYQYQYYAFLGDRCALIRLEDNHRRLARNSYRWSTPTKGPPPPKRTRDEWIASLSSDNPAEQLATLVWLSGTHLPSTDPRADNADQESIEDSKRFESVRDAEETRNALRILYESGNPWVREYARVTLEAIAPQP